MERPTALQPQLVMIRRPLTGLVPPRLPDPYTLRTFEHGDERHWEQIITESFKRDAGQILFDIIMRAHSAFQPERIFFITHHRRPVATASAWHRKQDGPEIGYLHYVGCMTNHQGRGLGRAVSLAALVRMNEEGRKEAMLETDDFRLPAIRSYLNMGFTPKIIHANQVQRWKNIRAQLPQTFLS